MSVSVPCWRHCLSCRQLYFPSCQLTCAPPPSLFLSGISVFRAPFSVLRLPLHFIKVAARESQCQRRGRSNCSRTRLLSYCYNKFQLHFLGSFLSVPTLPLATFCDSPTGRPPHAQVRLNMRVLLLCPARVACPPLELLLPCT